MAISPVLNADVKAFADLSPVMMWSADETGVRNWFNQTWLQFRGRSLGEEAGFGWTEGVHPLDVAMTFAALDHALKHQEPYEVEYRLKRFDGEWRWVLSRGNPYDIDGAFAGFLGSCFDITDHRVNEERLGDALIERDALLREVHHRVKNNLQTLMALMRYMRRTASPEGREVLDVLNLRLVIMALVQKHLHGAETITEISVQDMLRSILAELTELGVGPVLEMEDGGDDLVLPGQATAYLGLAISEAIFLFSKGGCVAVHICFGDDHGARLIRLCGKGGELEDFQSQLGPRLVRQYARGAGATVDVATGEAGPCLELRFAAA